jgi:hypothetical protein
MNSSASSMTHLPDAVARRPADRFYVGIGIFAIALSCVGFLPSIVDPAARTVPLSHVPPMVVAHALAAIALLATFMAQTTLIAVGRSDIHRRLGVVGGLASVAFFVTGWVTVVNDARRGFDLSGDLVPRGTTSHPVTALSATFFGVVLVGLLFAGGFWFRRRADVHKRLMTMVVLELCVAPAAHLVGHLHLEPLGVQIGMHSVSLLPFLLVLHDWRAEGRAHPVSLWGAVTMYAWSVGAAFLIPTTPAWRAMAGWILG